MLQNIFLFKGKEIQDLVDLNIFSYPNEVIKINDRQLISQIIKCYNGNEVSIKNKNLNNKITHYKISKPIAQLIENLNIYTCCIDEEIIVGLIFEKEDNPYDYKDIFLELLNELLNNGFKYSFDDEMEIENLLISVFIDLRRYGDEIIERFPEIEYYYRQKELFIKVFLFGIDEVGKSSFLRRLKTGKFNDNFFAPTRKFNIEYYQDDEKGLLALWDMPGQKNFRKKWLLGLQDSNILIYMIDIANQIGFEESKQEFWNILNREELNGIPLIILGNKIDLIKSSEKGKNEQITKLEEEIYNIFDFNRLRNRDWEFIFTSVKTGFNIDKTIECVFNFVS